MLYKVAKIFLTLLLMFSFFIGATANVFAAEKKYLIVIDPAHGGDDPGVKANEKITEKDVTLAVARALQKELASDGSWEVVLTRDSDKTVTIEERKKIVAKTRPSLLISLHVNAGYGKKASGFEIYYPGFKEQTDQKKPSKSGSKDRMTVNKHINDSIRLGQILQKRLDSIFPRKGRGVREGNAPILEDISAPSVVVEIGFATNQEERKTLLSVEGQTEIAKTLAKGIKSYY